MDQGRQGRDQVDTAVVQNVRGQRRAAPASCARLQSWQLSPHACNTGADQGLVADELEEEADQDRREGGEPRTLCRLPNGGGRHPTTNVPGDSAADRGTTAAIMPEQSRMHFYLNWAKERIDEMDATLASLEAKASQVQADSNVKANQLIADLQKRRDEFQAAVKKQTEAGEAAWQLTKAQLESNWSDFEAQVKTYIDTVGKQVQQQQATFRDVAAAQMKAWREAAEKLQNEASKVAAARRGDIDAAVKQMKADASAAEARLQKLKQAGSESWTAFGAALAESRKAFDRAIE